MPAEPARGKRRSPRILVIGCGSIGKRHLGNLAALGAGELLAFDERPDRRQEARSQFGIETPERLEEAWARRPDAAIIAVPTSLHVPLAVDAASHGCHLFIEKPLSHTLDGVDRLLDIVRERRLVTLVGCNLRFHPGLQKVKALLQDRAAGRVVAARVAAGQWLPDWHPEEDYRRGYSATRALGGGIILDAIHELDYIRWLLGDVETVACFAGKLSRLEIETEDTAAILLRFAGGTLGEVHLDYVQRAYHRTCQIIGDAGTIHWDYAGDVRWFSAAAREWRAFPPPVGWEWPQMYVDEMRHCLRCWAGEERPALDAAEGRRVLEVAVAAKESAQSGRIVSLTARPEHRAGRRTRA